MDDDTTSQPNVIKEGWYEVLLLPNLSTHVAYVGETNFWSPTITEEQFLEMYTRRKAFRMIREENIEHPYVGIYRDTITGDLWNVNKRGKWTWMNGQVYSHVPFGTLVRIADAFEQL